MPSTATFLGGTDVKRCARRIHNEHDPTLPKAPWEPSPELQLMFDRGLEFEARVFGQLAEASRRTRRVVDLSQVRGKDAVIAATLGAMDEGVDLILGGWLADDGLGGRKGRPDLLVRYGENAGRPAYLPGDVKGHMIVKAGAKGEVRYSTAAAPTTFLMADGCAPRSSQRPEDYLQVAHYWRMLEAVGRAPEGVAPTGCIIGTDVLEGLAPSGELLVWLDLDAPLFKTYSRSNGTMIRTALERYDHEFGFRLAVAQNAALRDGGPDDPAPLVAPIFTDECNTCPWAAHCATQVAPDLASLQVTEGRLSRREWQTLADLGISTTPELAAVDPEDEAFLEQYLPEVANVSTAGKRLATAVRRARMIQAGVGLERTTAGPIGLARADVEIDVDIEWGNDDRVYLWGSQVNRSGHAPEFVPHVSWDVLDEVSENALAQAFVDWLRGVMADASAKGQTVRVYHYSTPEPDRLKKVLGGETVADVLTIFVDLHRTMSTNFFGLHGLGLKAVAPQFGFAWADDDAGGLQSQTWLIDAVTSHDPLLAAQAQRRLLQYNADDVAATAAIRNGLGAWDDAAPSA